MSQRGQWAFRHELRDSRARDLDAWLRQAKVEELGPRLGQHDVAGLQVPVNDSGLVRGREGVRVELRSRNNKELTKAYPAVAARGLKLQAKSVVLDGEVVALGASGRPSFQALQHRSAHLNHVIVYYVFDLLHLDGHDFTSRPLVERQAKLGRVVRGSGLLLSETLEGTPHDVVAAVRSLGLEGIIAKRNDSRYISGERSSAGQKLKLDRQREFVIGAYRPGGNGMNALLVGYYEGRQLRFAGKVRAGFTPRLGGRCSPASSRSTPRSARSWISRTARPLMGRRRHDRADGRDNMGQADAGRPGSVPGVDGGGAPAARDLPGVPSDKAAAKVRRE